MVVVVLRLSTSIRVEVINQGTGRSSEVCLFFHLQGYPSTLARHPEDMGSNPGPFLTAFVRQVMPWAK